MIVNAAAAAEGAARGEAWERLLDPATTLAGPWRSSFAVSFVAPRVALACDEREVELTAHGFPVRRKKGREGIAIVVLLADSAGCEGREVLAAASLPEARAAARKQRQRRREWNARRRSAETEGGDVEGREALYYASDSDDGQPTLPRTQRGERGVLRRQQARSLSAMRCSSSQTPTRGLVGTVATRCASP